MSKTGFLDLSAQFATNLNRIRVDIGRAAFVRARTKAARQVQVTIIGHGVDMSTVRNVKMLTLLQLCTVVIVILFAWLRLNPQQAMATRGMVDGILFSPERPSALVDGQILTVGDSMYGTEVVKITKQLVVFEKHHHKWQQRVRERPNPAWDEPNLPPDASKSER
jgi:hypothetical protein